MKAAGFCGHPAPPRLPSPPPEEAKMKTSNSSTVDGPIYRSPQWPPHHWPNLKGHPHTTVSTLRAQWLLDFGQNAKNWISCDTAAWDAWAPAGTIWNILGSHHPTAGYRAFMSLATLYYHKERSIQMEPPSTTVTWDGIGPSNCVVTPDNHIWLYYEASSGSFAIPWLMLQAHSKDWSGGQWPPTTRYIDCQISGNVGTAGWRDYADLGGVWMQPRDDLPAVVLAKGFQGGFNQVPMLALPVTFVTTPPA